MKRPILGTLNRYEDFVSRFVPARNLDVWLPPEYDENRPLPVIYMQDGQNLFDPELTSMGVDWGMDESITRLTNKGSISGAIVVGIWSTDQRMTEYMPQKALDMEGKLKVKSNFLRAYGREPDSDRYLRFLIEEVKVLVDNKYGSMAGRNHTFIMGSSMGGLLSLYALCEYPAVFGGAGCMSSHWPIGEGVVVDYVREALPLSGRHRIYFDYGTANLDVLYGPHQVKVDEIMKTKGYQAGQDWVTCRFEGADHSESAWRARVETPLTFLLKDSGAIL